MATAASACSSDTSAISTASEFLIGGCYRVIKKIGSGSFGDVYRAINITTDEEVAVKLEKKTSKHPQLLNERQVYTTLRGGFCIPRLLWSGTKGDYNVLVMDLLGPSLHELFDFCSRRFTYKTILMLADQMISRVEFVHSKQIIHRDLKPDNFLIGLGLQGNNQIFLIDFGLAKRYIDPISRRHIPLVLGKNLTGTARYASRNAHSRETSRRDDLESLAYVLLFFCRGSLPWQGLKANTKKQKYEKIINVKMSTTINELCKNCPEEFAMFLNYCRSLDFEQDPDYMFIRHLFRSLMRKLNQPCDYIYDWSVTKPQKASAPAPRSRSQPKASSRQQ